MVLVTVKVDGHVSHLTVVPVYQLSSAVAMDNVTMIWQHTRTPRVSVKKAILSRIAVKVCDTVSFILFYNIILLFAIYTITIIFATIHYRFYSFFL
jgi:hypothetical protein